jgi:cytochrome c-type biogenesis protein CcmH
MTHVVSRRDFFVLAIGAAGGGVLQDTASVGRVYDPDRAGRAQTPIAAGDNDKDVQALEKKLHCSCGCGLDIYTCRTTDFSCTYSPALHKQVLAMRAEHKTEQQVIDAFIAQYGPAVLMSPPRRGVNLVGYFTSWVLLAGAAVALLLVLIHWTRRTRTAAPVTALPPDATPAELERLRDELDRLPG